MELGWDGKVLWEYVNLFFRTMSVLGVITLCSAPIATRRTSQGCGGKPVIQRRLRD